MSDKKYPHTNIDRAWFECELRRQRKSFADLARFLRRHRSAISLMMSGKRIMSLDESYQIAAFLDVDQAAVARAAGIKGKKTSFRTHVARRPTLVATTSCNKFNLKKPSRST